MIPFETPFDRKYGDILRIARAKVRAEGRSLSHSEIEDRAQTLTTDALLALDDAPVPPVSEKQRHAFARRVMGRDLCDIARKLRRQPTAPKPCVKVRRSDKHLTTDVIDFNAQAQLSAAEFRADMDGTFTNRPLLERQWVFLLLRGYEPCEIPSLLGVTDAKTAEAAAIRKEFTRRMKTRIKSALLACGLGPDALGL